MELDGIPESETASIDLERDIKLPGDADYDVRLERDRAAEMDRAFQEFLAAEAVKQAKFRAERKERDLRIAARAALAPGPRQQVGGSRRRPSVADLPPTIRDQITRAKAAVREAEGGQPQGPSVAPPPPVTALPPGRYYQKPVLGRFPVKPAGTVAPNDADAGAAQATALAQTQALATGNLHPVVSGALPPPPKRTVRFEDTPPADTPPLAPAPGASEWHPDGNGWENAPPIGKPTERANAPPEAQAASRSDSLNAAAYAAELARSAEN